MAELTQSLLVELGTEELPPPMPTERGARLGPPEKQ